MNNLHEAKPTAPSLSEGQRIWLRGFLSSSGPGRELLQLKKGDTLYRKGGRATHVYVILRGHIELIDKSHTPEILSANRWLFESAHELGHFYLQNAVALTECTVMAFPSERFIETLTQHPALNFKFVEDTAERVAEQYKSHDPAAKRLARHLLKLCDGREVLIIEATPKSLGIQIGATRQRVTDILKEFNKTGMALKLSTGRYRLHKQTLERFLGIGDDE